jgi:hypothetical protein
LRWEEDEEDPYEVDDLTVEDLDLISIIVLFVKHVHLQNVGAAERKRERELSQAMLWSGRRRTEALDLHAAAAREARAPRRKRRMLSRWFILSP